MSTATLTLLQNNQVIDAPILMNNFNELKNVTEAIEDENISSASVDIGRIAQGQSVTVASLAEAVTNLLFPTGCVVPFVHGQEPPNVGVPGGGGPADPDWWPADGTVVVAPSSALNTLTMPNHNDSGTPATYAPYIKGGATYNATPVGANTHTHSNSVGGPSTTVDISDSDTDANVAANNHAHTVTINPTSNEPLHIVEVYFVKL